MMNMANFYYLINDSVIIFGLLSVSDTACICTEYPLKTLIPSSLPGYFAVEQPC